MKVLIHFPTAQDWISLLFILVAVYFLTRAERLRTAELAGAPAIVAGARAALAARKP